MTSFDQPPSFAPPPAPTAPTVSTSSAPDPSEPPSAVATTAPGAFAPPSAPVVPRSAVDTVASALASLDASWTVHAAPRIGLDRPDFVAIHDRFGVCLMQVLDWTPETTSRLDDGRLVRYTVEEGWAPIGFDPRVPAARLRSSVFDQFFAMPEHGGSPSAAVRSVVIVPGFTTAEAGALFPRAEREAIGLVGVLGGDALESSIDDVVRGFGCPPPPPVSIAKLRAHTSVAPTSPGSLGWSADMTPEVVAIAENAEGRRHRRLDGAVGSGKSFALAARAARLASQGRTVLTLSFNVTFASGLRTMIDAHCRDLGADPTLVSCSNFHSFCTRVVSDAEMGGVELRGAEGKPWTVGIVEKATHAYEAGSGPRFDAIMIDEGQDFTSAWWDLLVQHVLVEGGETVVAYDRTQDLYRRSTWLDETSSSVPIAPEVIELDTNLRLPTDLLDVTNEFAASFLGGHQHVPVPAVVADTGSIRRWTDVERVNDIGGAVGREVVRILRSDPSLRPGDVAFVCDYHHDGVRAAAVIERAGYPVHHVFSRNPDDPRRRRRHRFWLQAGAVKGSTAHSMKGWESPVMVVGVGAGDGAKRLAYVALTRTRRSAVRPATVSVVNADPALHEFGRRFVGGSETAAPPPETPAPPPPSGPAFAPPVPGATPGGLAPPTPG